MKKVLTQGVIFGILLKLSRETATTFQNTQHTTSCSSCISQRNSELYMVWLLKTNLKNNLKKDEESC